MDQPLDTSMFAPVALYRTNDSAATVYGLAHRLAEFRIHNYCVRAARLRQAL